MKLVDGIKNAGPGVYWVQIDNGYWVATSYRGNISVKNTGSRNDPWPSVGLVKDKIEMVGKPIYMPDDYTDANGELIQPNIVSNAIITKVATTQDQGITSLIKSLELVGEKTGVLLESETGRRVYPTLPGENNSYLEEYNRYTGNDGDNGYPKNTAMYLTPLTITWRGKVIEQKKIQLSGKNNLKVNEQTYLKGEVSTIKPGEDNYGNPVDISTRTDTTWSSDKKSVVEVNESGRITGKSKGIAKITVRWKEKEEDGGLYDLMTSITVTVTEEGCLEGEECGGEGEDPSGGGACKYTINPPSQVSSPTTTFMEPGAQGHILGDDTANGRHFDATLGIPTSENLYANTWAMKYLYQHTFGQQKGTVTYDCNAEVTYLLKWKEKQDPIKGEDGKETPQPDIEKSENETKKYSFSFTRNYSYWKINNLEVYKIDRATMSNYALPNGNATLLPKGYSIPSVDMEHTEDVQTHVIPKETSEISFTPEVVDKGGYTKPTPPDDTNKIKSLAEGQTKPPDVKNDALHFSYESGTTTVMDGSTVSENGPTPSKIPDPSKIGPYKETGEQVLYQDRLLISKSLINQAHTSSTGTINYSLLPTNVGGSGDKSFSIQPINTVTVHTPVVNYSSVTDDQAHNQKTKPNYSRAAFILDRPFKVRIPTDGQHVSYPGYGDRDYAKYVRTKEVYFPFDVYSGDKRTFYSKNTWIPVPVSQPEMEFFLPVWVDEGDYTVYFRTIAENAPTDFTHQPDANTDLLNHVATDTAAVEVIGRLYDFHITDIADYEWETVFRSILGSPIPSGFSYWTGLNGIDGAARGNSSPFILPVRPGSHPVPSYSNVAVKTGYHFKFDLKTKGNMFTSSDGIRVTPSFYYVAKDGSQRQEVDLYYSKGEKHFIRIGSAQDEEKRFVVLNSRLRNVPAVEMTDTAAYRYAKELTDAERHQTSKDLYTTQYMTVLAKEPSWAGRYFWMLLSQDLRTFIGPKDGLPGGVDPYRASASIQHWYGEYSLPADVVAVKKGTSMETYARAQTLDDHSDVLLKNGYIVVNFNLESIRNGDTANPHLQYIHAPLMNQWKLEGFESEFVTPKGNQFTSLDGDVLYYYSHLSSRDDFSSEVPH
ncbi:DUF5704 domain-containing protein [Paenibacillus sp. Marseille-Q4541]|uniref:DUF5704 domain-containing protein n=1 Tax=Paenibacillus sp. Marseille-Q4541 TaxID=2831522 RepID=UPI0032D58142